ncbi:MAG: prepilin peptidase [Acidimicrobiia bacterium]|nr:prepilin peptidase [Acidimicrobiia bacterium]
MPPFGPDLALAAAAGLAVGSFLNVAIHRLPLEASVVAPPSSCPACGRSLRWFENIPVASWVALGGRCRTCRAPIAGTYPLVELATATLFVAAWAVYGWQPLLLVRLAFACAMVVLFVVDLRHYLLPDAITLPGIVAGLASSAFVPPGLLPSLMGAALGGGLLLALAATWRRVRGVDGLGMGDVKMLAMVGAFLGWQQMLVTLFLASVAGSLVGIGLIVARRGNLQSRLPLGSFLAAGALVASLAGDRLLDLYLSLY